MVLQCNVPIMMVDVVDCDDDGGDAKRLVCGGCGGAAPCCVNILSGVCVCECYVPFICTGGGLLCIYKTFTAIDKQ